MARPHDGRSSAAAAQLRASAIRRFLALAAQAILAFGALAILAACGGGGTGPPDAAYDTASYLPDALQTLQVGGLDRTYRLHLPAARPWRELPLVIMLHGRGASADGMGEWTGLSPLADRERFAAVYPNAVDHVWNIAAPYQGIDDVAFISRLIDDMVRRYPVDPRRVYVMGHSNGAFMTYRLARELSDRILAIAPVAGTEIQAPFPDPRGEVAILHVHALDDPTVLFGGEPPGLYAALPVDTVLANWRRWQHCATRPDTLLATAAGVLGRRWRSASGHGDVLLYTTPTGGHSWIRASNAGLEATEVIWSFFRSVPNR